MRALKRYVLWSSRGAAWLAACAGLSGLLACAAPLGTVPFFDNSDRKNSAAKVLFVLASPDGLTNITRQFNARIIGERGNYAAWHGYLIATDQTISAAQLYSSGARLVLIGQPPSCGPAYTTPHT